VTPAEVRYTSLKIRRWKIKRVLASFGCALLLSAVSLCQISSTLLTSVSTGPNGAHGTLHFHAPLYRGAVITGSPYSAERINEREQTLADGTRIADTYPATKIYRDSMGRTREERPALRGPIERHPNAPKGPIVIEINDPVARLRYIFIEDEPVVHRQELPDSPQRASGVAHAGGSTTDMASFGRHGADDPTRPHTTSEDLGPETIEGIQVEGHRLTTTWPVGAEGNDRPITHTQETWMSQELKVVILKSDDPRFGEQTNQLVNISRSEPEASLFEPPAGYTVKDETGEFTIDWSTAR
jgi:hypothetical protein